MEEVQENSFGVIPLRQRGGQWQVFLIQHQAGHWAFPKGHSNVGEMPRETALRELKEETGYVVAQWLSLPSLEEQYTFVRTGQIVHKTVVYFLAYVGGRKRLQSAEIRQGRWVSCEEAEEMASFPEAKRLCVRISQDL